jgi:PII-like signaling protein
MKQTFQARMLRAHFTEADKWEGQPLYKAIVAKCKELGLAGAFVHRGLEGFGASARIYHSRSLTVSKNAPVMVSIMGTTEQIQTLLPHLDKMLAGGLLATSTVQMIRYSRSEKGTSDGS